ncbi:MAG TPA: nucleotidyl transferase AbiEii/AbiGii toxin family protein [Anaerolineae bacterium]|nr:nucleotidyl transferase AbiEii/AbiGii toxin family protein [Anaerolineae bacterium]
MKEYLADLVRTAPTPLQARNIVREYLQARILGAMQRAGAMVPLAFHGGTALRFLYHSQRYSEDLDFALERARERYNLRAYLRAIETGLTAEGYALSFRVSDRKVVHSAFVRFPGLLYELGLSPHRGQVLAVKIEVDTNPPSGAGLETTIVRRHVTLHLQHHDRASLLAGKLHAILQRSYFKGRDLYDLLWYLSDPDWPPPNLALLNNALRQTGWSGPPLTETTWRAAICARLEDVVWERAVEDVYPFLGPGADATLLTPETLRRVLGCADSISASKSREEDR